MKKIALIYSRSRADTIGVYIEKAISSCGIAYDHFCSTQMSRIPQGYDLYFRITDGAYEGCLPGERHPSVFWVSDVHIPAAYQNMKKYIRDYDLVFCFTPLGVEKLTAYAKKVKHISFGCDPDIHKKINLPKKYDLAFVGTDGGIPRKFILQELKERYPNSYIGLAPYTKMAEIYSQAKIGFNYPIRLEGLTMRSFEIGASGTLQIMPRLPERWLRFAGFVHGENVTLYDGFSDLMRLIDYYLEHEEERERIADCGYTLMRQSHTYQHKVREAFEIIKQELGLSFL